MTATLLNILEKIAIKLLSEFMIKRLCIALLKEWRKRAEKTETKIDDDVIDAAIEVLDEDTDTQKPV